MLNVGIIGIGNAGNQVATIANEKLSIPVIAINSSEKDLETVPSGIPKKLISDTEGLSEGAGKDRRLAQKLLKDSIENFLTSEDVVDFMTKLDFCFIVSSTGGGTGSGVSPIMTDILSKRHPDTNIVLIGILPESEEALDAQVNTLEYLNELYKALPNQPYMLYDNDKYAGLPTYQIMEKVNNEIVGDIEVLRCSYNYTTKYNSIDNRDMTRLITFPGRIVVSRLEDFKDKDCDTKTIEDMLIDNLKRNSHVELQRDKKVMATGVITNLSQTLNEEFNNNIPNVREFIGSPVHSFNHIYVNEERGLGNNVFLIISGLSPINDRIYKISDIIKEMEEKQRIMEEENALSSVDLKGLTDVIADKSKDQGELNLQNIFDSFGAL